ncbi:hypothetical protein TYRP_018062 [Tyrophagus putrescentiae]|nr:hypothetical protein TYRP_018062 [Tyrophagus putrescentiae]
MPEPPMLAPAQATAIERERRKTARLHQLRATPTMKRAVPKHFLIVVLVEHHRPRVARSERTPQERMDSSWTVL